ncbi:MAG: hypothetical protein AB1349_13220 [Elusimicrobiota bacterium]
MIKISIMILLLFMSSNLVFSQPPETMPVSQSDTKTDNLSTQNKKKVKIILGIETNYLFNSNLNAVYLPNWLYMYDVSNGNVAYGTKYFDYDKNQEPIGEFKRRFNLTLLSYLEIGRFSPNVKIGFQNTEMNVKNYTYSSDTLRIRYFTDWFFTGNHGLLLGTGIDVDIIKTSKIKVNTRGNYSISYNNFQWGIILKNFPEEGVKPINEFVDGYNSKYTLEGTIEEVSLNLLFNKSISKKIYYGGVGYNSSKIKLNYTIYSYQSTRTLRGVSKLEFKTANPYNIIIGIKIPDKLGNPTIIIEGRILGETSLNVNLMF